MNPWNVTRSKSLVVLVQRLSWEVNGDLLQNSLILMPFSASDIFFVLPLPCWQNVSPRAFFFHLGKQKKKTHKNPKVTRGEIGWIGRVGNRGHTGFGQKLLNTQYGVGMWAYKSPIMKWANSLKEPSKKFSGAKYSFSQCQLVQWYRWVPKTFT